MKANKLLTVISAAAISFGASQAAAQEVQSGIFKVSKGASQKIDRFGVCKVVKNSGANPIMVPAGSKEQWSSGGGSFLTNAANIPSVSIVNCPGPWESLCGPDRNDCVLVDFWLGGYAVIVNGDLDAACIPGSSPLTAAQKTSWLTYAKSGNSDVEQPSKHLWEIGFMTQWATKATAGCNITDYEDWYLEWGDAWPVKYPLTTILRNGAYPHQVRDSYYNPADGWWWSRPAFYDPSDHNELYIFDLIVN